MRPLVESIHSLRLTHVDDHGYDRLPSHGPAVAVRDRLLFQRWWYTPAKVDSRRYFKQGEVFPQIVKSDYGDTFWIWDRDQTPRTLI